MRLFLGDCLAKMPEIEPASVDLILADLPYGTTACRWDSVIPFEPLWAQYRRLLRPGGAVVLTACQPFSTKLINSNPTTGATMPRPNKGSATSHEPPLITELRSAIADSGQTPYELAKEAGINPAAVYRFLTRERSLSLDSAARIHQSLGLKTVRPSKLRAKARP